METALTTTAAALPPTLYTASDSLADLVKLKPSNMDLIQLTSRISGSIPGKFRDYITQEHFDAITVVPLHITTGRVMFPPDKDDFTLKPLCRSNDGIVPSQYVETPQASSCGSCRYSKWGKVNGKSIRPDCSETYTMFVIVKESELPRRVKFKGTGIKPLKEFMERIETDRMRLKAKEGRKPNLFEYVFTLSSQEIIGKSGKYFIPMFTGVGRVSDPNAYGPFYEQYILQAQPEDGEEDVIDVGVNSIINNNTETDVHEAKFVDA